MRIARRVAFRVAAITSLGMVMLAPRASADVDQWQCSSYYSAQTCYAGTGYRSYVEVSSFINPVKYEICAKGVTAAGNRRTGSGCNINANVRHSCFDGINPYSAAYVYWAGGGSPTSIAGDARTPSSVNWC